MMARVVLGLAGLFFGLPLLWLLLAPFSRAATVPVFTLDNFARVLSTGGAIRAFGNSLWLSGASMVLVTALACLAGYALSRRSFRGRDLLLSLLVLFSNVVTGVAAIVPLFTLLLELGLLDTSLGVILALSGGLLPGALFILKDFVDALPRSYEEASLVDGATPWLTFRHVVAPLLGGGASVVALLTFVSAWGNFLTPYILLRTQDKYPASVAIYGFFNEVGLSFVNVVAAYSLLYTLPVLLLYLIIQKVLGFKLAGGINR